MIVFKNGKNKSNIYQENAICYNLTAWRPLIYQLVLANKLNFYKDQFTVLTKYQFTVLINIWEYIWSSCHHVTARKPITPNSSLHSIFVFQSSNKCREMQYLSYGCQVQLNSGLQFTLTNTQQQIVQNEHIQYMYHVQNFRT